MANKFIIFVVFAVLSQISLGGDQNELQAGLTSIHSGAGKTLAGITRTFNGFYKALSYLAKVYSKNQNSDGETTSKLEAIKNGQIEAFTGAYDIWIQGLEPIAGNVSAITAGVDQAHEALGYTIELFYTSLKKIEAQDYSTYPAAIREAKQVAISQIHEVWVNVFDLILNAVNTDDKTVNSAITSLWPLATNLAELALGTAYDGLRIVLIELPRGNGIPIESCLTAIETRREASIAVMTNEGQMKMSLFQSIGIASFLKDSELMADVSAIANAEESVWDGFKNAFAYVFAAISELEECDDASSIIEPLADKLSDELSAVFVNTLVAISYMKPAGSAVVSIDDSSAYEKLTEMIEGIVRAIESTQKKDADEARAEILTIEKQVTHAAIHVFGDIFQAMKFVASDISDELVTEIIESWKDVSVIIKRAIQGIFTGIGILLREDTDGIQCQCETNANAIETAQTAVMLNFIKEVTSKFRLIRASHLYAALQDNGYAIPLSILLA